MSASIIQNEKKSEKSNTEPSGAMFSQLRAAISEALKE